MICSNQYILGPAGPLELNLAVVLDVCDRMTIPKDESLEIWQRIQVITATQLKELRDDAEAKAKLKKMRGGR